MSPNHASTAGCSTLPGLFQDPLLEEPPSTNAPVAARRQHAALEREAEQLCHACPLLSPCLYRAVVQHDVAGYVAGTTQRQRARLRTVLGVRVAAEDFDTLAGVARTNRQVDHDEVLRLRHASPDETLEQLAHRLGCSLSTVKRHLRNERHLHDQSRANGTRAAGNPQPPTEAEVLAANHQLNTSRWTQTTAA